MAASNQAVLTDNSMVNGVLWDGWKWSAAYMTYYFADDHYAWTADDKVAYSKAINALTFVNNLTFTETTDRAAADFVEIQVDSSQMASIYNSQGLQAFHETPDPGTTNIAAPSGNPNIGANETNGVYNWELPGGSIMADGVLNDGAYGNFVFVHELGHGLGLKHPHSAIGNSPQFRTS